MAKKVLVVAAHTDDEALGCGGTIAKHVAKGDEVFALFLTDGVNSRANVPEGEVERRQAAANLAAKVLGFSKTFQLAFPDNRMDSVPLLDIVQAIESVVGEVQPEIIYTHHGGDLNIDHQVTNQALLVACRPLPNATVKEIYTFEVMSSTEWAAPKQTPFMPNVYVDISEFVDVKKLALEAYALEMRSPPHSRNIRHILNLAEHRGNSIGKLASEAFEAIRILR